MSSSYEISRSSFKEEFDGDLFEEKDITSTLHGGGIFGKKKSKDVPLVFDRSKKNVIKKRDAAIMKLFKEKNVQSETWTPKYIPQPTDKDEAKKWFDKYYIFNDKDEPVLKTNPSEGSPIGMTTACYEQLPNRIKYRRRQAMIHALAELYGYNIDLMSSVCEKLDNKAINKKIQGVLDEYKNKPPSYEVKQISQKCFNALRDGNKDEINNKCQNVDDKTLLEAINNILTKWNDDDTNKEYPFKIHIISPDGSTRYIKLFSSGTVSDLKKAINDTIKPSSTSASILGGSKNYNAREIIMDPLPVDGDDMTIDAYFDAIKGRPVEIKYKQTTTTTSAKPDVRPAVIDLAKIGDYIPDFEDEDQETRYKEDKDIKNEYINEYLSKNSEFKNAYLGNVDENSASLVRINFAKKLYEILMNKDTDCTVNNCKRADKLISLNELLEGNEDMYVNALKEEFRDKNFRDAVLRESLYIVPGIGKLFKKRVALWVGGPSASGKTTASKKIIERLRQELPDTYFKSQTSADAITSGYKREYFLFIDGGAEREISQMRQLILQVALAKGYRGIDNLESKWPSLKLKKSLFEGVKNISDVNLIIPATFSGSFKDIFRPNPDISAFAKKDIFHIFSQVIAQSGKEDTFKETIKFMGTSRAFKSMDNAKVATDKLAAVKINNTEIGVESKEYNENAFTTGVNNSKRAKKQYIQLMVENGKEPIYVRVTNDLVRYFINDDGIFEKCGGKGQRRCKSRETKIGSEHLIDEWNSLDDKDKPDNFKEWIKDKPEKGDKGKVVFTKICIGEKEIERCDESPVEEQQLVPLQEIQQRLSPNQQLINILFVRHGFSCSNLVKTIDYAEKVKLHTLYKDTPLTDQGITESKEKGKLIIKKLKSKGYNIDGIASSGLLRAIQTAHYMFGLNSDSVDPNIKVMPFIAETFNTPSDTPMDKKSQQEFLKESDNSDDEAAPSPIYLSDDNLGDSNYKEFMKWLEGNLTGNQIVNLDGNPKTLAIVSHNHFLRNQVSKIPEKPMNNNDAFMLHFVYDKVNNKLRPLTPITVYRVRETPRKKRSDFCSHKCTPIKTNTLPLVKQLIEKAIWCPKYKGRDVSSYKYEPATSTLTLKYLKTGAGESNVETIGLTGKVAEKLNNEWVQASSRRRRNLIRYVFKHQETGEDIDIIAAKDKKDTNRLSADISQWQVIPRDDDFKPINNQQLRQHIANLESQLNSLKGTGNDEWWKSCRELMITEEDITQRVKEAKKPMGMKLFKTIQDNIELVEEIDRLKEEYDKLTAEYDKIDDELEELEKGREGNQERIAELENELTEIKEERNKAQKELVKAQKELVTKIQEVYSIGKRGSDLQRSNVEYRVENSELLQLLEEYARFIAQLQECKDMAFEREKDEHIGQLTEELQQLKEEKEEVEKAALETIGYQDEKLEEKKKESREAEEAEERLIEFYNNYIAQLKKDLQDAKRINEKFKGTELEHRNKIKELGTIIQTEITKILGPEGTYETLKDEIEGMQEDLREYAQAFDNLEESVAQLKVSEDAIKENIVTAETKLRQLKEGITEGIAEKFFAIPEGQQYLKDLEEFQVQAQDLKETLERKKNTISEITEENGEYRAQIEDAIKKAEQFTELNERIKQLESENQQQQDQLTDEMDNLMARNRELNRSVTGNIQNIEELEERIRLLQEQTDRLKKDSQKEKENLQKENDILRSQLETANEQLKSKEEEYKQRISDLTKELETQQQEIDKTLADAQLPLQPVLKQESIVKKLDIDPELSEKLDDALSRYKRDLVEEFKDVRELFDRKLHSTFEVIEGCYNKKQEVIKNDLEGYYNKKIELLNRLQDLRTKKDIDARKEFATEILGQLNKLSKDEMLKCKGGSEEPTNITNPEQLQKLQNDLENAIALNDKLVKEIIGLEGKLTSKEELHKRLRSHINGQVERLKALEKDLRDMEELYNITKEAVEKLEEDNQNLKLELTKANADVADLSTSNIKAYNINLKMESQVNTLRQRKDELQNGLSQSEQKKEQLEQEIIDLRSQLEQKNKEHDTSKAAVTDLMNQMKTEQEECGKIRQELQEFKNLMQEYAKFIVDASDAHTK
jgi:chromosome segregation ATPase/broad specificity phosphatase PhoE